MHHCLAKFFSDGACDAIPAKKGANMTVIVNSGHRSSAVDVDATYSEVIAVTDIVRGR